MCKTLSTLFTVLTIMNSASALADPEVVAYAKLPGVGSYENHQPVIDSMNAILDRDFYEIQQDSSSMKLQVKSPIGKIWVTFKDFKGSFSMLENDTHSDLASIEVNAESMETNRGMVSMMLKSRGFLDVENFPSMSFVGHSFEWFGDKQAIMKGYLTIKDTTRLVSFYVELIDSSSDGVNCERVSVNATASIKRSEFGITTLLPIVGDNVNLYISINAVKKNTSISMR